MELSALPADVTDEEALKKQLGHHGRVTEVEMKEGGAVVTFANRFEAEAVSSERAEGNLDVDG